MKIPVASLKAQAAAAIIKNNLNVVPLDKKSKKYLGVFSTFIQHSFYSCGSYYNKISHSVVTDIARDMLDLNLSKMANSPLLFTGVAKYARTEIEIEKKVANIKTKQDRVNYGFCTYTLLMEAAKHGKTETVKTLINMGFGDNGDTRLRTALMYAAANGETETLKALIDMGVEKDRKDTDGKTALMWAAIGNYPETFQALIDKGAGLDIKDNNGWTALMWAAWNAKQRL